MRIKELTKINFTLICGIITWMLVAKSALSFFGGVLIGFIISFRLLNWEDA